MARRVAEILLLRVAGRDTGRQVGKICDELLANIEEPHPGLMADVSLNSSDASAFHQNLKNKIGPSTLYYGSSGIRDQAPIGADMLQAALRSIVAWERRLPADCIKEPVDSPMA
jgi:hypothetical protein